MSSRIFIQIASYRDPQLRHTLKSCIDNSKFPENLVFAIARQYHPADKFDDLSEYKNDTRFKIIDIPYEQSKGVCWARNSVQQLYDSEEYTLQIDSHMRFEKNWDFEMIEMIEDLKKRGYKKPLLTAYASSFNPANDPEGRVRVPWRMSFDRFSPEGVVFFVPEVMPDWEKLKEPVPARFYSAHFCFTSGEFAKVVQHNPDYYFHGEEISIAARAYTHGYDLFHPHRVLIWHEYTRKERTKHWDDDKKWTEKNIKSHATNRKLFGIDGIAQEGHDGVYGFGNSRTLRDYEKYAGILFEKRSVQKHTLEKHNPPDPTEYISEKLWLDSFKSIFKHCIDISCSQFAEDDYDFWSITFHSTNNDVLYRSDANIDEIALMRRDPDGYCKIWREFSTDTKPAYWAVHPHSKSKGWCRRIIGKL